MSNSPQINSGTASPAGEDANGYLLLTIQHTVLKQVGTSPFLPGQMTLTRSRYMMNRKLSSLGASYGTFTFSTLHHHIPLTWTNRLECISLPIPADIGHQTANPFAPSPSDPAVPTHDFWLVLRVGTDVRDAHCPAQLL